MEDKKLGNLVVVDFGSIKAGSKYGEARWCRHVNLLVDPDARIVWCKDCGEHLDPIDILVGYAKGEESRG